MSVLCDRCGERQARIHIGSRVDLGQAGEPELHALCRQCAAELGIATGSGRAARTVASFFSYLLPGNSGGRGSRCPGCGAEWVDIEASGRLGCMQCLSRFGDLITEARAVLGNPGSYHGPLPESLEQVRRIYVDLPILGAAATEAAEDGNRDRVRAIQEVVAELAAGPVRREPDEEEGPGMDPGAESAVVATWVRIARNLAEHPFPGSPGADGGESAAEDIDSAVARAFPECRENRIIAPREIADRVGRTMVELPPVAVPRLWYPNPIPQTDIFAAGADHLWFTAHRLGYQPTDALADLRHVEHELGRHLNYAADLAHGYLTADLATLGWGLRIACVVHLPGLSRLQPQVLERAFSEAGILVGRFAGDRDSPQASLGDLYAVWAPLSSESRITEGLAKLERSLSRLITYEQPMGAAVRGHAETSHRLSRARDALKRVEALSDAARIRHLANLRLAPDSAFDSGFRKDELSRLLFVDHTEVADALASDTGFRRFLEELHV